MLLLMVVRLILPPKYHRFDVGKGCRTEGCQIDVGAEKGDQRAAQEEMQCHDDLDSSPHQDENPQRSDIHKQYSGEPYKRHEYEHDRQVGRFLHGVELLL